ncbi:hypothetical protein pEaSNUABM11_00022 [Erwinia phage pEa_SNUABM_11]|nr:hypothetical protein pEaSNUABM11_00022 [Erwinia phage pEa_SNUABM_11]
MTERDRQKLTVQFLHTALEDIFLSIEEMPNARYEDHLAPFVNQKMLNDYLVTYGLIEPAETIVTSTMVTRETIIGITPLAKVEQERQVLESTETLTQLAWDREFGKFRDAVEKMIVHACRQLKTRFNPYATVTLLPLLGRNARIVTLELTLGEDIRHSYYRKQFPGGRYRSNDDEPQVCDIPGLREAPTGRNLDEWIRYTVRV